MEMRDSDSPIKVLMALLLRCTNELYSSKDFTCAQFDPGCLKETQTHTYPTERGKEKYCI